MMTFDQFRNSGRDVDDIGALLEDSTLSGCSGRIYCNALWIERVGPGFCGITEWQWYTLIGRADFISENLSDIERVLYEFAVSEGFNSEK